MSNLVKTQASPALTAVVKRWPIVLLVGTLVFGGLLVCILHLKPMYTSQITMILPAAPDMDLAEKPQQSAMSQTDPYVVRSYTDVIKDDAISRRVITQLHLTDVPEFQKRSGKLDELLGRVRVAARYRTGARRVDPPAGFRELRAFALSKAFECLE